MKGGGGPRIIENTKISLYVHGPGGVVKGAGGPRIIENTKISLKGVGGPGIIENTKISLYFPWFGRRGEGRRRSHNH